MKNLIFVHGLTGSGKSTVCQHLSTGHGYVETYPLWTYKRYLESTYGLCDGALDTREGKAFIPDGCQKSMQEIMVDSFHFWAERDPYFTSRSFESNLARLFTWSDRVAVCSVRNTAEVQVIQKLIKQGISCDFIDLTSNRETRETSDHNYFLIRAMLLGTDGVTYHPYKNDLTKNDLYRFTDAVVAFRWNVLSVMQNNIEVA